MKRKFFSLGSGLGAGAVWTACALALPLTALADRYPSRAADPRGRAPTPAARPAPAPVARPAAPAVRPSAPAVRPSAPRPSVVSRPSSSAPLPSVSRPSVSRPPSVVTRPPAPTTRPSALPRPPSVVTRPSVTPREPSVVTRPSGTPRPPSVVTRPALPARPTLPSTRYPVGGYSPDASVTGNRYTSQVGHPEVRRFSGHYHFTDRSRFANIDRHYAYRHYPHSHYRLNYARGYRGMGWYYGPPNYNYYYEAPYVTYYSQRSLIPSTLLSLVIGGDLGYRNSVDYQVQRQLYELGYYNGPLDGDIGPMSRLAIANFQADNGLEPNGIIDENLLYYLGIQ